MAPIDSSSDTLAQENTFELVAAGPTDPKKEKISLAGKPMRPAGAAEQVRKIKKIFSWALNLIFPSFWVYFGDRRLFPLVSFISYF